MKQTKEKESNKLKNRLLTIEKKHGYQREGSGGKNEIGEVN